MTGASAKRRLWLINKKAPGASGVPNEKMGDTAVSDIVIAGYLGFANSGDEALLSIVLSEIKRRLPGKTVTVLSMKPKKTHKLYGVRARHRYNAAAINGEFSRGGVFLFGGGSLIQDVTSHRSLLYYLWLLRSSESAVKQRPARQCREWLHTP